MKSEEFSPSVLVYYLCAAMGVIVPPIADEI